MRDATPYPRHPEAYTIARADEDIARVNLKVVALKQARMISESGSTVDVWAIYGSERHLVGVAQNGRFSHV